MPIRVRLTLAFAVAMTVVLTAMGAFVYLRVRDNLNSSVDQSLRSRADAVAALARESDSGLAEGTGVMLTEQGESLAQLLTATGRVVDTTPQLGRSPLLSPEQAARAARGTVLFDLPPSGVVEGNARLLATPVAAEDGTIIVVVGTSLEPRDEALAGLLGQLAIGGGIALVLVSVAGYLLAGAALRPVESLRRRAAEISAVDIDARLPLPPARDEIRRLGQTLNEMLDRLAGALAREQRFVADASHELRTPLALLKTELELATRRTRSADELRLAVRSAAEETDRLAQLAEDLLVLTRSDQGELPLRRDEIAVRDLLESVASRYASRAVDRGRRVRVVGTGLTVRADRLRLDQALGNLVENALRHGDGAVTLTAVPSESSIELHVRDEGPGFSEAFLPRAFERFSRADDARGRGGTGLGLAIVDVIGRAHGGRAHAANLPAGGADVWIAVPRA